MAISKFVWNDPRGFDAHLMRNNVTPAFISHLVVIWDDGRIPFLASKIPPDLRNVLSISFQVLFSGAPNNFNVQLNPTIGQLIARGAPPGSPQLRNFLLDAIATDTSGGAPKTFHQKMRVHVHTTIQQVWLTPDEMTVHQGAKGVRFAVMARFDDGVVGDISDMSRVTWSSQAAGNVGIDETSGELDPKVAGTDATIEFRRPGIPKNAPADATATVHCVEPWATPLNVNFVAGPSSSVPELNPGRNILFLGDGFEAGDSGAFDHLVRATVEQLRRSPSTRPFDLCAGQLSFWSAFTASRQAGVSIGPEVVTLQRANELRGLEVPLPVDPASSNPPPPPGQPWTLPQLVHQVGLPVPIDDHPARPLAAKIADWQTLYGPIQPGRAAYYDKPDPDINLSWLDLVNRTLVNNRDTAFSLSFGERPRVQPSNVFREVRVDSFRMAPPTQPTIADDLNSFLSNLQFEGINIGARWALNGSDFGLVIILARTNHNGGVNTISINGGYITAALASDSEHVLVPADHGLGFDVQAENVPVNPHIALTAAAAHETAHSFGLNDEYAEANGAQAKLLMPSPEAQKLAPWGNVQGDADLRRAPNGPIVRELVKWNWPRLKKAGICAERPGFVGSGTVQAKLRPGHASLFRVGDMVALRGRDLLPSRVPGAPPSLPLTTYRLKIESIEPGDVLTMLLSAGQPDPSTYPVGSLVVCPVRDSDGKEVSLIAPFVLDHIVDVNGPLNRPDSSPLPVCTFDLDNKQQARNLPKIGLFRCKPRKLGTLVGLFDGGAGYHCGVYHPTGFCIMRARIDGNSIVSFCPVCRYVLVDALDPTQHGIIDDEYSKQYPQA